MAKLKSKTQCLVELKEEDYLILLENTIKMEAFKIAGIEKMAIYKAMEHIYDTSISTCLLSLCQGDTVNILR